MNHHFPFIWTFCIYCVSVSGGEKEMPEPIVKISKGKLLGVIGKNFDGDVIYKFFGIPYARPPVGDLRFQPPQESLKWNDTRDATQVGDSCRGRDDLSPNIIGSEDCLYANVYTKNLPTSNSILKPVMVFIHGGGLTMGSSRPEIAGPDFLMLKDIVLVTFNYRLGALGFISSDDPKLELSGNLGLKDQNLLLKWVQKNIKNFNGDPDNVTLFGNSAGSSSVHAHILSAKSKGLFHKAILQSGTVLNSWSWGTKNNLRQLVENAGRNARTEKEALDILKQLSVDQIFDAQEKIYDPPYPAGRRPFSIVIEIPNKDAFLSENPVEIINGNHYNQVPMIFGYTENEGMLLDLDNMVAKERGLEIKHFEFANLIPFNLNVTKNSDDSRTILWKLDKLYSGQPDSARYDPMTDAYLLVGIIESMRLHLKNAEKPIYLYRMSLAAGLNHLKKIMGRTDQPGVCHADELGYLFHTTVTAPIKPGSLEDRSMRGFVDLWTNFATYGDSTPNDDLKVKWCPVKNENNIQLLDIGEKLQMKELPEKSRMLVWWDILMRWPLVKFA